MALRANLESSRSVDASSRCAGGHIGRMASVCLLAAVVVDPFAFFQPTIRLQPSERAALNRGAAFARAVPAPPRHVAVVAAVPVQITGDRLVAWIRDIAALKQSPLVKQIGRFSPTPSVTDLQALTLDEPDATDIATCKPASCGVKLAPSEIAHIRRAMRPGRPVTDPAVQQAFREVVVERARTYLRAGGDGAEPPAFLSANLPAVSRDVRAFPSRLAPGAEHFLYWAKDAYAGKPVVSVTHVTVVRSAEVGAPEVLVIGRQVFATHYIDGTWSLTSLVGDENGRYLVYVNQSQVDLLDTWYAGLVRRVVERRIRDEAVDVLNGLRRRLQSGEPPVHAGQ